MPKKRLTEVQRVVLASSEGRLSGTAYWKQQHPLGLRIDNAKEIVTGYVYEETTDTLALRERIMGMSDAAILNYLEQSDAASAWSMQASAASGIATIVPSPLQQRNLLQSQLMMQREGDAAHRNESDDMSDDDDDAGGSSVSRSSSLMLQLSWRGDDDGLDGDRHVADCDAKRLQPLPTRRSRVNDDGIEENSDDDEAKSVTLEFEGDADNEDADERKEQQSLVKENSKERFFAHQIELQRRCCDRALLLAGTLVQVELKDGDEDDGDDQNVDWGRGTLDLIPPRLIRQVPPLNSAAFEQQQRRETASGFARAAQVFRCSTQSAVLRQALDVAFQKAQD